MRVPFFTNQTANASSSEFLWHGELRREANFSATGTFDGATLTLEYSADGTTFKPVSDEVVLTDEALVGVRLSRWPIRATLSSVGASTDISCEVRE